MTVETVKSVLQMQSGSYFKAFRGKVVKVGDVRAVGTGTVQEMTCEENGSKLKLSFWDHDNLPMSWEGRHIYVVANEQGKSLMFKEREYTNKFGKLTKDKGVSVPADASLTQATVVNAPATPGVVQPRNSHSQSVAMPVEHPKLYAGRCAQGMILALKATAYAGKEFEKTSPGFITPDTFAKLAIAVFGSLERAGMLDKMPAVEAPKAVQAPPPPPEPDPDEDPGLPAEMPADGEGEEMSVPF